MENGKSGRRYPRSTGTQADAGKHQAWTGTVSKVGVLEMPRPGGTRRWPFRVHTNGQQRPTDPTLQFCSRLTVQVRLVQSRSLQDLPEWSRRNSDAFVCRRRKA